jgi:hypothetical protein
MLPFYPRAAYAVLVALLACSAPPQAGGTGGGSAGGSGGGGGSTGGGAGNSGASVTIDFDELTPPSGVTVSSQYLPNAEFRADTGFIVHAFAFPSSILDSPPMGIAVEDPATPNLVSLSEPIEVVFPSGAKDLRFYITGVNSSARFADLVLTRRDNTTTTRQLMGAGTPATPMRIDLSSDGPLSKIRLENVDDAFGIGYDSFTFVVP